MQLLVALVLGLVSSFEVLAVCTTHGHTNGCSIPLQMDMFYKTEFTPSCNEHDICYHCASMFGKTRAYCDERFYNNMLQVCSHFNKRFLLAQSTRCKAAALTYYEAVRVGGILHYLDPSPSYCTQSWIKACL